MIKHSALAFAISTALLAGCSNQTTTAEVAEPQSKVKNVIFMIGDGMGPQQVGLLEEYAQRAPHSVYNSKGNTTALSKLAHDGHMGLSLHAPYGKNGSLVVDSACSATQLATGVAAGSEMIGLDDKGNVVETLLERAKAQGKATGLVSDTRITHATPASFAAHQPHRSLEAAIAVEMVESGNVDVMLSGGARVFLPSDIKTNKASREQMAALGAPNSVYKKSKRKDDRNVILEAKEKYGYSLAFDKTQLASDNSDKILGLFANSGMSDAIEAKACAEANSCVQPTLREMTLKALDVLSKDEDGFFLMIEGGQIDWAGHVNDAGWMLNELIKFDESVEAVYEWVKDRNDTLVVITADHETGSFGLSYSRSDLPKAQTLPGKGMQGRDYKPNFNFGDLDKLDSLYNQSASFYTMMSEVNADWDFTNTTGEQWAKAINNHSEFKVTPEQAEKITLRERNDFQVAGHKYLSAEEFPKIDDFKEFYVYGDELHGNLIGRVLGAQQNIVWGTGTHTAAPVTVYAFGPEAITKEFSTMQHHVDISQKIAKAMLN